MMGLTSSSSSSSSPGSGSRASSFFLVVRVLVPLLVVALVVLLGFHSNSWFASNSFSSSPSSYGVWRSAGYPSKSSSSSEDGGNKVSSNSSDDAPEVSLPAVATLPSPASEPESRTSKDSGSENIVTLPRRARRRDLKLERLELGLAKVRAAIREVIKNGNQTSTLPDKDYTPKGTIYRNAYAFHRSYLEMEKLLKVYVYEEGEPPIFHSGPGFHLYTIEGRFIHNMEMDTQMRTRNPEIAHVHFLPFSVVNMVVHIYRVEYHEHFRALKRTVADYIDVVARKYPYWNRSLGADHFMLSCHDWGPVSSTGNAQLFSNSIRVLCNANTSEGFKPSKDVSLPEVIAKVNRHEMVIGGPPPSSRTLLAFFAGGFHGPVRPLLKYWQGRDADIEIYDHLPKGVSYMAKMRNSKFCLCPSGYEVASPRIVEAIHAECVPVPISDHYVLPFSDVLNWKTFSVQIAIEDIPNIKKILMSISPSQYAKMQMRVKMVQRHFILNTPPQRYDVYNMILHSIWLRRLNVHVRPEDGLVN